MTVNQKSTCADGHPMKYVIERGDNVICTLCKSVGKISEATVHPSGEFCRKTGCHPDTEAK